MLEEDASMKLIFFVIFASDKNEATFAESVDFPEPELPKTKMFFDFSNLENHLRQVFSKVL